MKNWTRALLFVTLVATASPVASQCGFLETQWETPPPTRVIYGFGGGWISGVPDPVNLVLPTDMKGVYERYFTAFPGVVPVKSVRVGLGYLLDPNDDVRFQVSVYDDNGAGEPGALIGSETNLSPTALGVPAEPAVSSFEIEISTPLVPTTAMFHVGVEIFAGDAFDSLAVGTSCLGPPGCPVPQGEADASNHIFTSGFAYENLLTVYGADFDVEVVPNLVFGDASFSYDSATYTIADPDPVPTITGTSPGTFSSSPAGLAIDPATGVIDLSASSLNTYTVTYTVTGSCGDSAAFTVTIEDVPVELMRFTID